MNPGAGPECEKIRQVLLVRELWTLYVVESLINCCTFEADELPMKPNRTKNRSKDIQVLKWMYSRQKMVVAIGIMARCRQKSTQKLEFLCLTVFVRCHTNVICLGLDILLTKP